ncbi:MAG: CDP-alcohol phosphatidyltransferase family protein [Candidatus Delongbacteria bacterium]|nr:CDP-alcohol phosphatidyltransferase family protein [Candidatus Delongbacteria bacterium]
MIELFHHYGKKLVIFVFNPLIRLLLFFKFSPNTISLIGFLINLMVVLPLSTGHLAWGGIVILLGGLFDMLDGYIARGQNRVTKFGALLDSTLDRYSELFLFFGVAVFFIRVQALYGLLGIFFTISGSLMVSYVRARAEGLGIACSIGLIQRPERIILMALGCFLPYPTLVYVIYFLAVTSNLTVIQRIYHVYKHTQA